LSGGFLQALDPRDRVFALLELVTDAEQLGLKADYSMSWQAVYYQLASALIESAGLKILSYCDYHSGTSDLPS
jgi:hypothetical protein